MSQRIGDKAKMKFIVHYPFYMRSQQETEAFVDFVIRMHYCESEKYNERSMTSLYISERNNSMQI